MNIIQAAPADATLVGAITATTAGTQTAYVNSTADVLIVLVDEDTSQTAADRLILPRPRVFLMPGETASFVYDGTASRNRFLYISRDPLRMDDTACAFWTAINSIATPAVLAFQATNNNEGPTTNIGVAATANTNEFTQGFVFSYGTTVAPGSVAGTELNGNGMGFLRGSASVYGGFSLYSRVRWSAHAANDLGGFGLGSQTPNTGPTVNPSTYNNSFSVSWDAAQTTLRARCRSGTTTTNVDLGANFPSNSTTAAYEIFLACANGQSRLNYFVRRLDSVVADAIGSLTTNLPVATTTMIPFIAISNNAAATDAVVQWNSALCKGGW